MKLTAAEFLRGLVSWQLDSPAIVRTSSGGGPLSPALPDPSGSISESLPLPDRQLHFAPADITALQRPYRVSWEVIENHQLVTRMWDLDHGHSTLIGVPDFGKYHRLVVAPRFLSWDDDIAFRVGRVVVRLASTVQGEEASPLSESHEGNRSSFTVDIRTVDHHGKYIEIIAPEGLQSARDEAYTVFGLVVLILDDRAVGPIVFSDAIEQTGDGTMYGIEVARNLQMQRPVIPRDEEHINHGLSVVANRRADSKALGVGLRWYERGVRSESTVDKLLAFYVGLEVLLEATATAGEVPFPLAGIVQDQRLIELLMPLVVPHGQALVDRLVSRIQRAGPSVLDKAEFYARERNLGQEFVDRFRTAKSARDPVMHGSSAEVTQDAADAAREALSSALKAELGLEPNHHAADDVDNDTDRR